MIITAPITDYIPASLLTADGDLVTRWTGLVSALGSGPTGRTFISGGAGVNLRAWDTTGILGEYMKGAGAGINSALSALALRDTGVYGAGGTRDAPGEQVITGVGYQGSLVLFLCCDQTSANINWSIGLDSGAYYASLLNSWNGTVMSVNTDASLNISRDVDNNIRGHITAMGADGFTITWTELGVSAARFRFWVLP